MHSCQLRSPYHAERAADERALLCKLLSRSQLTFRQNSSRTQDPPRMGGRQAYSRAQLLRKTNKTERESSDSTMPPPMHTHIGNVIEVLNIADEASIVAIDADPHIVSRREVAAQSVDSKRTKARPTVDRARGVGGSAQIPKESRAISRSSH
jgi:hypothetical protein